MARRLARWVLFVLTTATLVGCDHATKIAARSALEASGPVALVRGLLELRYVENRDTAFSLTRHIDFPGKLWVLAGVSCVAIVALAAAAWRRGARASRGEQLALVLVAAGAIGNVLDRLGRGYVIDFIHLQHWPVFNVADVLIVAGCVLLAMGTLARKAAR
jgi:signal peptidase II